MNSRSRLVAVSYTHLDVYKRQSLGRIAIHTQLGRFLAAPGAVLLTTVRGVKGALAGVDTSLADLPRAALAGVQSHVCLFYKSRCV